MFRHTSHAAKEASVARAHNPEGCPLALLRQAPLFPKNVQGLGRIAQLATMRRAPNWRRKSGLRCGNEVRARSKTGCFARNSSVPNALQSARGDVVFCETRRQTRRSYSRSLLPKHPTCILSGIPHITPLSFEPLSSQRVRMLVSYGSRLTIGSLRNHYSQ